MSDECTVRVIFHSKNKGKGGAIQTAMRFATGSVLVIQDADLEYDPEDWGEMYHLIAKKKVADVVYGSRFYGKPHRSLDFHHYIANRLISTIFNICAIRRSLTSKLATRCLLAKYCTHSISRRTTLGSRRRSPPSLRWQGKTANI